MQVSAFKVTCNILIHGNCQPEKFIVCLFSFQDICIHIYFKNTFHMIISLSRERISTLTMKIGAREKRKISLLNTGSWKTGIWTKILLFTKDLIHTSLSTLSTLRVAVLYWVIIIHIVSERRGCQRGLGKDQGRLLGRIFFLHQTIPHPSPITTRVVHCVPVKSSVMAATTTVIPWYVIVSSIPFVIFL